MKINFVKDLDSIEYAIREFVPLAEKLKKEGMNIIYLNIGDPLKYDFKTPEHIIEAAYKASKMENKNFYSHSQGIRELREAITRHEKKINNIDIDPDDVIVTQGVSEAISFVARILLNPGDEILVPSPSYPLYMSVPKIYHAEAVEYRTIEDEGWIPDIDDIRSKINEKTKFIVIINPNNPTGIVYSHKTVRDIINIAGEYNIPIVSDEIYNKIILDDDVTFESPAKLSKDVPVFVLNGFSKAYLMTGWRIGYIYLWDPSGENIEKAEELLIKMARLRLCINTPAQYGALAALEGPQDHIHEMIMKFRRRSELLHKRLDETNIFYSVKPKAAFYIFPRILSDEFSDDRKFVYNLLINTGVFMVHGSGFGSEGKRHVRIVTLPPEEVINEAMDRILDYIRKSPKKY